MLEQDSQAEDVLDEGELVKVSGGGSGNVKYRKNGSTSTQ